MRYIITKLKKFIDKIYYNQYYGGREILIREIFPWINNVWEFKELTKFLNSQDSTNITILIKVIWDFYWWEVSRLSLDWKFSEIERNQWLLDFAQSLKDYNFLLMREANEDNT